MLLAVVLLFINNYLFTDKKKIECLIKSVLLWNIWSFLLVEILSQLYQLNRIGLFWGWGALNLFLIFVIITKRKKKIKIFSKEEILKKIKVLSATNIIIAVIGLVVLGLSVLMVPYNWDSMTYHLPRIAQWAQNQSVAHYAVNDIRQISSPVLAEFINVQVYLTTGKKDMLLNLLQSCSYLVNAWIIYEIALKIGCKKRFASLAVLLFMTMPIAFGEALNTQVDLFAALWLLIFVFYFIDIYTMQKISANRETIEKCIIMSVSICFGFLAKPSVNVGMAVLLVILLIRCIRKKDSPKELFKILLCVIPVAVLLFPELMRNYITLSAFADPSTGQRQLVGTLKPNYLIVNTIKNLAQNMPNIYLYDSNEWIAKIVMAIAAFLGVNINDTSIAEDGVAYVLHTVPSYGIDTATNPVIIIFVIICVFFNLSSLIKKRNLGNTYSLWVMLLFIVFCAAVRWEPYVTRYMLAYLALLCPMIGFQIQDIMECSKKEYLKNAVIPILYFVCLTEFVSLARFHQEMYHENAGNRPYGYYAVNKGIREEYFEVIELIKKSEYNTVGIHIGGLYEYPIWAGLSNSNVQIKNVLVDNKTAKYTDRDFLAECIITRGDNEAEILSVEENTYLRTRELVQSNNLAVYILNKEANEEKKANN